MTGIRLGLMVAGALLSIYLLFSKEAGRSGAPVVTTTLPQVVVYARSSPTGHRMTQNTWGCQQRETLAHITELRAQGDMEATTAALSAGIDAQDCITLDRGDEVYLADAAVLSGLSRVRKAGQTAAYWVAFEAVTSE